VAAGMMAGALLIGVHMAMTHGVTLGMLGSYIPSGVIPGLGKISGTAWSLTDILLGKSTLALARIEVAYLPRPAGFTVGGEHHAETARLDGLRRGPAKPAVCSGSTGARPFWAHYVCGCPAPALRSPAALAPALPGPLPEGASHAASRLFGPPLQAACWRAPTPWRATCLT
jgi:hypothetical protein